MACIFLKINCVFLEIKINLFFVRSDFHASILTFSILSCLLLTFKSRNVNWNLYYTLKPEILFGISHSRKYLHDEI